MRKTSLAQPLRAHTLVSHVSRPLVKLDQHRLEYLFESLAKIAYVGTQIGAAGHEKKREENVGDCVLDFQV